MHKQIAYYLSPIGTIKITAESEHICSIYFVDNVDEAETPKTCILSECTVQLAEYFAGERFHFSFPYRLNGTDFQQRVWNELSAIAYGTTTSYKNIATTLGDPKLIRAVGSANGKNPISIAIPCHRVVGHSGKLVGYAGGLWRKRWLLDHEQKHAKHTKLYTLF